jgi:pimeloyl-ACP methyl ester carboxylesterase
MGAGDASLVSRGQAVIGDLTIPYMKGGRGRPLLYLHGLGGWGRWDTFHIALALTNTVYAPQLPGWADGRIPEGLKGAADYSRIMAGFLDVVGMKDADVVGHSFGGWVAIHLAAENAGRITKLVLMDPLGLDTPGTPAVNLEALDQEAFLNAAFAQTGVVAVRRDFGAELEDVRSSPEFEKQWKSRDILIRLLRGRYGDPDLIKIAQGITAATLILWGREDRLAPSSNAAALAAAIPHATLAVIPETAHSPMRERRETSQRIVRNFLLGVEQDEDADLIVRPRI